MTKARKRYCFGSKRRDAVWYGAAYRAHAANQGFRCTGPGGWTPICNLCGVPVLPTDPWDDSHVGAPKALGGRVTGVAHRACNQRDNNLVVTPMVARAKRRAAIAQGRKGPGLGRCPMRAGRFSAETKTFRHGVKRRQTLAHKIADMRAKRAIVAIEAP